MLRRYILLAALVLAALPAAAQTPVTVFAAASLTDALGALARDWTSQGHPEPKIAFAASSTLARQIEQGAPADLFLSADEPWMDYLQTRALIVAETRASLLGNALVLVAPRATAQPVTIERGTDLAALLKPGERIATGDPAHVPVGRYAQSALQWLGQWSVLEPRLARSENVRAALLLVEHSEVPFGIVYATDAALSTGVSVVGTFPAASHPPISYPAAVTKRAADNAEARAFLSFLAGPEAAITWRRFGFRSLG